jgi:hypothetical protein
MQLNNVAYVCIGDTACEQGKRIVEVHYENDAIDQIGCVVLAKINTGVYHEAEQVGKFFPKGERKKVAGACLKETIALRELEKSEEFAQSKRGIWLPKLKELVSWIVDRLQGSQVDIVVVYMSAGGHAVIARELIQMLRSKWRSGHFVSVLCKPYNEPLCETIYENNKAFVVAEGLISIEFESELLGKSFEPRDYSNNLSLFTLLNERRTGTKKSAQDLLGLMDKDKHYSLKLEIGGNPKYRREGWFRNSVENHKDITTDAVKRGVEDVGVCAKCIYTISGNTSDGQIQDAIVELGKGNERFHLNYRLLHTPRNMDLILIGKYEPC